MTHDPFGGDADPLSYAELAQRIRATQLANLPTESYHDVITMMECLRKQTLQWYDDVTTKGNALDEREKLLDDRERVLALKERMVQQLIYSAGTKPKRGWRFWL